ncbi:hypothetical protein Tco_1028489 [Tanacetum coccineum]|uniref:DUF8039 domain-containing protein n=1 Tax=Tanacetum coccineum TaxID=301880 RepID=A0ABQ5G278_9ASTR
MAVPGGANQISRCVIDDLIEFSEETSVDGYMSFFKSQQIADSHGFINRLREESNTAKNLVGQLNALIAEMEALKDQGELFDTLMDLRDDKEAARTKLQGLNELITQADQEIEMKEAQIQAMNGLRYGSIFNILQGRNELLEKIIGCVVDSGGVLALDPKDHLVNYDNDNENDDLGYRSEEYFDEADEEDENNHSNGNVVKRGITRLYKFRREYGKPDGIKLSVTFDALNRISGKHRALFSSFLGDMVREHIGLKILSWKKVDSEARDKLWDEITRYFDVDLTVRKLVMNRLGQLLRNFRRKLRQTYILPNQNTLSKLNEVPAKYSAIVKAEEWVNFVKYTTTKEYKIENKEIKPDEEPPRGILWLKGRVNKDREFPDDEIRSVGDKIKEIKDKIKEATLKVDHGIDAMTVALGKEKGGYARGVGSGQASDERIVLLQSQLDNGRPNLAAQGEQLKSMLTQWTPSDVSPVDINPIDSSADEEGRTPIVGCENDASIQKSNGLATSEKEMETRAIKCKLWHLKKSTIIALGTVYETDGKQMLHNKEIRKDCYKVSIDKCLVDAACIPDVGNNGFKTVKDAVGGFFAWSKNQVVLDPKATPPSTIQMIDENKTAPKLQKSALVQLVFLLKGQQDSQCIPSTYQLLSIPADDGLTYVADALHSAVLNTSLMLYA